MTLAKTQSTRRRRIRHKTSPDKRELRARGAAGGNRTAHTETGPGPAACDGGGGTVRQARPLTITWSRSCVCSGITYIVPVVEIAQPEFTLLLCGNLWRVAFSMCAGLLAHGAGLMRSVHARVVWLQRPTLCGSQDVRDSHQIMDSALLLLRSHKVYRKPFGIQTFLAHVDSAVVGVT